MEILSGLNFRLVSKELFYLCFNKALGESNSEDKFLEAVSSLVKHFQPLLPQEKSDKLSYHLHAPQLAVLLAQVLHGSMEGDSIPPTQLPPGQKSQRPKTQTLDDEDTDSTGPAYICIPATHPPPWGLMASGNLFYYPASPAMLFRECLFGLPLWFSR